MATANPIAIIDIGSNSVRLVVYAGPERIPAPIFNEKLLAGLGSCLEETGRLPPMARTKALTALARFELLARHMKVKSTRVLATAAIRDAEDGPAFVREIGRLGLKCEVLPAQEEARLAGEGVLSGIPGADGIVGDLGGGSLELVEIAGGAARPGISLPLGVLRVERSRGGEREVRNRLRSALVRSGIAERGRGRPFYMVGGSWRTLARIDMLACDYPLPITHQYRIPPERARELQRLVVSPDPKWGKVASKERLAHASAAAMLLALIAEELEPSALVASAFGIREGFLFSKLKAGQRALDPLVEAARDSGGGEHRFGEHGDLLDAWLAPLFDDAPAMRRLRLTACLLADVAWQANPAFRADRAVEMALHGNWVGVTPPERVILAQALSSNFGRERLPDERLNALCSSDALRRAHQWGVAMRLGQRFSAGVGSVLKRSRLTGGGGRLRLELPRSDTALVGDQVRRRLSRLAEALGCEADVVGT